MTPDSIVAPIAHKFLHQWSKHELVQEVHAIIKVAMMFLLHSLLTE